MAIKIRKADEMFNKFYEREVKQGTSDGAIWEYQKDIVLLMRQYAKYWIQKASEVSEADLTILNQNGQHHFNSLAEGHDYEVAVSRQSILQLMEEINKD